MPIHDWRIINHDQLCTMINHQIMRLAQHNVCVINHIMRMLSHGTCMINENGVVRMITHHACIIIHNTGHAYDKS